MYIAEAPGAIERFVPDPLKVTLLVLDVNVPAFDQFPPTVMG